MYRIVFLLLSSLSFISCKSDKTKHLQLPYYNQPDFTPIFLQKSDDVAQRIPHTIDSFSFLNQDSVRIGLSYIKNKIHVANFVFTTCGSICPIMTKNLKIVGDHFMNDPTVVLMSYSVTPWIDKPTVLKNYMKKNGIQNTNWQFLTGERSGIYQLARKSYFAEEDIGFSKDSSQFLHTEHVILVDQTQRIRGVYNGTLSLEMQHLIDDIELLRKEDQE